MKKIVLLSTLFALLLTLVGCADILGPMGLLGSDKNQTNQNNPISIEEPITEPVTEPAVPEVSAGEETKRDGSWVLYDSQMIVPKDEIVGNEVEFTEYEFFSSETSIGLSTDSTWPALGNKPAGSELIKTYGSWTVPEEEYFAGHTIHITLTAKIDKFVHGRTNYSGINVWAYYGKENTPLGNPTKEVLRDNQGKGTCSASINNGKIVVDQATKEVRISAPKGTANEKMVILIVVSNQNKQGGVKYLYEWKDW